MMLPIRPSQQFPPVTLRSSNRLQFPLPSGWRLPGLCFALFPWQTAGLVTTPLLHTSPFLSPSSTSQCFLYLSNKLPVLKLISSNSCASRRTSSLIPWPSLDSHFTPWAPPTSPWCLWPSARRTCRWQFILTLVVTAGGEVIHKVAEEIVELQRNPSRYGFRDRRGPQEWPTAFQAPWGMLPWGLRGRAGGGPIPHSGAPWPGPAARRTRWTGRCSRCSAASSPGGPCSVGTTSGSGPLPWRLWHRWKSQFVRWGSWGLAGSWGWQGARCGKSTTFCHQIGRICPIDGQGAWFPLPAPIPPSVLPVSYTHITGGLLEFPLFDENIYTCRGRKLGFWEGHVNWGGCTVAVHLKSGKMQVLLSY